jgi:hypothetical protein
MDDRPSSDQANTSTTIMVIWILTGMILVSAAFFVAPYSNPRLDFNVAGIVAALYLIALVIYIARKPLRLVPRIAVVVLALLAMGATAFSWITSQNNMMGKRESQTQQRIAGRRGNLFSTMSDHLLSVLRDYYQSGGKKTETLKELFCRRNGQVKVGDRLNVQSRGVYFNWPVYLAALEPDSIVLIAMEPASPGRDPGFRNFNGKSGAIQERMTLTTRGIIHESQN